MKQKQSKTKRSSAKIPGCLYFARKVISGKLDYEQQQGSLKDHISRPITPKDNRALFKHFQCFRTLNISKRECYCSWYRKYLSNKHLLAFMVSNGEWIDPYLGWRLREEERPWQRSEMERILKERSQNQQIHAE